MSNLNDLLEKLHEERAKDLLVRIQSGEATAAEMANAIRFLKDNGIDANTGQSQPLMNLATVLPFDPEKEITDAG